MADDEQFDLDADSDIEDEEDEGSDDDTGFFPIDEPIVHSSQTSTTTTTTSQTSSKQMKATSDQSGNKYSTGINASSNYPQDNNFEYVGKFK
jgi:hypothetical protein